MALLFCYGTLKQGFWNNRIIEDAKFVGDFKTKKNYRLFCNGSFPYMVDDEGKGQPVHGEVFEVNEEHIKKMDRLEGHPTMYCRKDIEIEGLKDVQAYFYQSTPRGCRESKNGVWPLS